MATPLDPKQVVSFEELLISQMVQQEALTRLLIAKGIFTKVQFFVFSTGAIPPQAQEQAKQLQLAGLFPQFKGAKSVPEVLAMVKH